MTRPRTVKPRVLLVGRTRYRLPLEGAATQKFAALSDLLDLRVLASAPEGSPTRDDVFSLVPPFWPRPLDGLAFHLGLPFRVARELRRFDPRAVIVQGAHEGAAVLLGRKLARSRARVVVEVHGDWRTATRLYGSPARRLLSPAADGIALLALRRADAVRTVSEFTTELVRAAGRAPTAVFPAFMELEPFLKRSPVPLPTRPAALFVGVLELYKGIDVLTEAWRLAAPRVPEAELRIVGRGSRASLVESLVRDLPRQASWRQELGQEDVAAELDRATVLVLPSRSEGMGRVVVEALCRGRPVIGSRVGGIPELVRDGQNGILVEPGDPAALAAALASVLSDRALAERLASGAGPSGLQWLATPEQYAAHVRVLVEE